MRCAFLAHPRASGGLDERIDSAAYKRRLRVYVWGGVPHTSPSLDREGILKSAMLGLQRRLGG